MANDDAKAAMADFPVLVEEPVYYCGFNSPKSFGGNSYLIRHPDGNWLIDSPKFIKPIVRRLEDLGGVDFIFLTHRDDVADARQFHSNPNAGTFRRSLLPALRRAISVHRRSFALESGSATTRCVS